MAVSVGRTIRQLNEMADSLGLSIVGTGKDGKKKKEDYIYAIREYNLKKLYGGSIPRHLSLMLNIKSPMLAGRIDSYKKEQQDEVWNSDEWDFEQKLNGVRCLLINDGNGIHMYSRHNSDVDLLPICFTDRILLPDGCDLSKLDKEFIIDCEITSDNPNICTILEGSGVETASQLQAVTAILGSLPEKAIQIQRSNELSLVFNSFDCLYFDKQWVMNEPLVNRRKLAEEVISQLETIGFNIRRVPHTNKDKMKFFKGFIDAGMEGCVAKRLNGVYIPDTTRNFQGWVKLKRKLSAVASDMNNSIDFSSFDMSSFDSDGDLLGSAFFSDTIDVFVTGYEPGNKGTAFEGLVGSVSVSAYVRKDDGTLEKREVGKFSGITMDERQRMTEIINGEPTLKPEYYNRVVEVDAVDVTKNLRFAHCTFIQWRWDKLPDSCIIDESFLYKNLI